MSWQDAVIEAFAKHRDSFATKERIRAVENDITNVLAAYAGRVGARFMRELVVLAKRPAETLREELLGTGNEYVLVLAESQRIELDLADQGVPVFRRPYWPWVTP